MSRNLKIVVVGKCEECPKCNRSSVQKNGRVGMNYRCGITGKSVKKAINKFGIADSCPLPDFWGGFRMKMLAPKGK